VHHRPVDNVALSWRVFAINAIVLVFSGVMAIVVLSPGRSARRSPPKELAFLAVGLGGSLGCCSRASSRRSSA